MICRVSLTLLKYVQNYNIIYKCHGKAKNVYSNMPLRIIRPLIKIESQPLRSGMHTYRHLIGAPHLLMRIRSRLQGWVVHPRSYAEWQGWNEKPRPCLPSLPSYPLSRAERAYE